MGNVDYDLIVIGAGPGGYVAAIRGAQLGMKTACIEKEPRLGGTCLRVGCIPSKALLESSHKYAEARDDFAAHGIGIGEVSLDLVAMMKRKDGVVDMLTKGIDGLLRKNKVTRLTGHGKITGPGRVQVSGKDVQEISARHILIATGSVSAPLPGVELDGDRIGTSTEALSWDAVPEHLVVIGAGVIGLELGSVWRRLGAKVTVLEYLDRILPGMDDELASLAQKQFEKQGMEFCLGAKVTSARCEGESCSVEIEGREAIACDRVLLAVGRRPNTEALGLENVGIETNRRGQIEVDEYFRTSAEGIYAIGDVIPGPMLAHKAEEEAIACIERLATGYGHVNYKAIPGIVYTHPEIASVGATEEELKAAGTEYRKGSFPYAANGRARAIDQTEGVTKVLADAKTDRILGVHIIGHGAGDMIAEAATAIEFGASSEDLARACHAHPTLSEILKEAALAVDKRAIHY